MNNPSNLTLPVHDSSSPGLKPGANSQVAPECPICGSQGTCQTISAQKPVQVHLASYGYSARTLGLASGLHEVWALCIEKKCSACESEFASGSDMDETIKNIVKALNKELGPPRVAPRRGPLTKKESKNEQN